ncbi:glycoside hydrolase family 76 protein [Nocardia sp. NPDC088792]|uniref:glycoside hydrolase family 76 protein n=1 Tax=Nocardia sp. NPDC088792 TaxID=3364332 RepID=UPI00380982F3
MAENRRVRWGVAGCVVAVAGGVLTASDAITPEPIGPAVLQVRQWSRVITLTSSGGGATATLEHGQQGDSVWLERSTDGGASPAESADTGAESGPDTAERLVPGTAERLVPDTAEHLVPDTAERLVPGTVAAQQTVAHTGFRPYAGGMLRACGKPGDRDAIRCTRWFAEGEAAADRRQRAVERLLDSYDHAAGRWENGTSIWQSANALTALIDYMARTGDRQYLGYIDETYEHGMVAQTGVPRQTGYNDDELWWALAWIDAFDLTADQRYLQAARIIVDGLDDQHAAFCDGGIAWARMGVDPQSRPWTQVNAITNALYLTATAQLSTRVDSVSRPAYSARALRTREWFTDRAGRALLDPSGLINDHLDQYGDTCVPADAETRWTYVQGAMISGLVAEYRATRQAGLLTVADSIAAAATGPRSPFLRDGVLSEPAATNCPGPECKDAETFKGVFVRSYRDLLDTGRSKVATEEFLSRQVNSLIGKSDAYGFRWGAVPDSNDRPNYATQAAALDALNAAD